jgi:hypothetical protein
MEFKTADWPLLIYNLLAINIYRTKISLLQTLIRVIIPATKPLVRLGKEGQPSHTTLSRQGSRQATPQ